jgi:hypothetical protein
MCIPCKPTLCILDEFHEMKGFLVCYEIAKYFIIFDFLKYLIYISVIVLMNFETPYEHLINFTLYFLHVLFGKTTQSLFEL